MTKFPLQKLEKEQVKPKEKEKQIIKAEINKTKGKKSQQNQKLGFKEINTVDILPS